MESVGPVETGDSGALPDFSRGEQAEGLVRIRRLARQPFVIPAIPGLWAGQPACPQTLSRNPGQW